MNTFAEYIRCAGSCHFLPKALSFAAIAFLLTGFFVAAQAQYYFLPDLPVYWGPYPPNFINVEPYTFIPEQSSNNPRPFHQRHRGRISIRLIEQELAKQGYHLIVPVRRKGDRFLCVAADHEGHRQRIIYSVSTGAVLSRVWLESETNGRLSAGSNSAQTQNPSQPKKISPSEMGGSNDLSKPDSSAPAPSPAESAGGQAINPSQPQLKPSEPVSSKPASTDEPQSK